MPSPAPVLAPPSAPPLPAEAADFDVVQAVVQGNREAFEILVRRYNSQLYRTGMAYLRNHAQAEDMMQNAYLKAFLHLRRFRGTAAFSTWLMRIMINECLMLLRRQRRFRTEPIEGVGSNIEQFALPADPVPDQEMKILLERAIDSLPRGLRTVYVLREVQRLSTAQTAACLGKSCASVKVSLHRARARLREELLRTSAGVEVFDYPARRCDPMTARVMQMILGVPSSAA